MPSDPLAGLQPLQPFSHPETKKRAQCADALSELQR